MGDGIAPRRNPYDAQWIEGALVAHVNERVRAAQLQDLRCKRCRKVKVSHLASRCVCGGLYDCVEDKRGVADDLRVMHNIASRPRIRRLKDVVEWIAESSPNLEGVAALREGGKVRKVSGTWREMGRVRVDERRAMWTRRMHS